MQEIVARKKALKGLRLHARGAALARMYIYGRPVNINIG